MKKSFGIILFIVTLLCGAFWLSIFYTTQKNPSHRDTLIVGTSADFKPMSFKENDTIVGFDIDIATEAARRIGKKIELRDMPFELLIPQLQLGTIHCVAAGLSETADRAKRVIFSPVYLGNDPLAIVVRKGANEPQTMHEALERVVAVNQGYTADLYLSKMESIHLRRLPSVADAILALRLGQVDAFVTGRTSIAPFLATNEGDSYATFSIPDTDENMALALSRRYPELAEEISKAICSMLDDGFIDQLREKWHVQ
jgi:polar amino acid transport system substrate-binding protein